jgi:hypothetical protein
VRRYANNALVHPIRAVKLAVRRWAFAFDDAAPWDAGPIPPELAAITVGERIPFKGVWLKVEKVVGAPVPAVLLVPDGLTHGRKLQTLRQFRVVARHARQQQRARDQALQREAR